ncbi:hypothetical protein SBDP1_1680028 [Syntrophobacter sp. SbD1]|nr:hypothetical protein SBDP1_1680028 [Syntrophobacter sp. SbD1]
MITFFITSLLKPARDKNTDNWLNFETRLSDASVTGFVYKSVNCLTVENLLKISSRLRQKRK